MIDEGDIVKRSILFLMTILFVLTGCTNQTELPLKATENDQSIDVIDNSTEFKPLLFWDPNCNRDHALILCGFIDGQIQEMNEYQYNSRTWSEYTDGRLPADVIVDFICLDEDVNFYNSTGISNRASIKNIRCEGRAIDEFAEVQAVLENTKLLKTDRQIGLLASEEPYPRLPLYSDHSIIVDLDGNGIDDQIDWTFSDAEMEAEHYKNYLLSINLNGELFTYSNDPDLPLNTNDLSVWVMDINKDGCMEVIVYEKLLSIMSSIYIYQPVDGKMAPMIEYVVNPGP